MTSTQQKKPRKHSSTADQPNYGTPQQSNFKAPLLAPRRMTNEQYEKELKAYRIADGRAQKRSAERWKRKPL